MDTSLVVPDAGSTEAGWSGQTVRADGAVRTDDAVWTDYELTELALAADRDAPLDPAALPIDVVLRQRSALSTLPQWYMPAVAAASSLRGRRAAIAIGIVVVLLALEALGLCSAYGQVVVG